MTQHVNYDKKIKSPNGQVVKPEKQAATDMISEGSPVNPSSQPALSSSCLTKLKLCWRKFVSIFKKPV